MLPPSVPPKVLLAAQNSAPQRPPVAAPGEQACAAAAEGAEFSVSDTVTRPFDRLELAPRRSMPAQEPLFTPKPS